MSDNLIRQLMEQVGMPNSTNLFCAIQQAENSGFQAGAASRDAEIAELNRRIEYWRNTARKYLVPETKVRKP